MVTKLLEEEYREIFLNSPVALLIIDIDAPSYTILDANNSYLTSTNTTRESLIGQSIFAVFPVNGTDNDPTNIERTIESFEEAIKNKVPVVKSNYRYDIPIPGTSDFEERYWTMTNTPVLDENGEVIYLINSPINVTEHYKLSQKEKIATEALQKQEESLYSTFMQAPVGIGIFKGPDYIVDLINPPLCELFGKTVDEMQGRPVFEALSHAKGMGFEELLDHVRLTGEPYKGTSVAIPLHRKGKFETVYVNFAYEPFRESDGTITGVIGVATEVTDQINSKNKIAEAEERARLAVDAVSLGTFDLNTISGEMITSQQFAKIFGFNEPVPISEYNAVFHPDDLKIREKAQQEAIITGKLIYKARIIWKDKSIHWIKVEGKVFYNDESKPIRIIGTVLDITSQKLAKEEQRKLITLVDSSVDLKCILDLDGTISYINSSGMNLLGLKNQEQVLNTSISDLHTREYYEQIKNEVLPAVISTGKWAGNMMLRHFQKAESIPVYNNFIRIDDPITASPIALGVLMRDMRPELASKLALEDSERLLKNITSAAPTGLWMSDEHGAMTYFNQTWLNWTGRPFEDNIGTGWLEAIFPEDRQRVKEKLMKDLSLQNFYEVEFRLNNADGTCHWCVANGQPQYRNDGSFSGYIGACVDITEQKYLQQQKDDFIGIASHELKTPVTSIKAYTQVLEKMLEKKGETREALMVSKMDAQINRLTSLIGDLLDVTKINSGKLQFNDSYFDFNSMVKDLIEDLQRTTESHTLIESFTETGVVFGDKERIGQVISNLVTNAIKYSPHSDKIVIHTSLENNEVILCVEDFGIGISREKLDKVFEQFYRVSGDIQHTFPGLGLGLYISSEIIKREGGRIWVNSVEDKGSSFCFGLPGANDTSSKHIE